ISEAGGDRVPGGGDCPRLRESGDGPSGDHIPNIDHPKDLGSSMQVLEIPGTLCRSTHQRSLPGTNLSKPWALEGRPSQGPNVLNSSSDGHRHVAHRHDRADGHRFGTSSDTSADRSPSEAIPRKTSASSGGKDLNPRVSGL